MKYDIKAGGKLRKCEVCQSNQTCWQHHLEHRRYGTDIIWVCDTCHRKIHANPEWAYDNNFMIKHNKGYEIKIKEVRKHVCTHSKNFYDVVANEFKCQFCKAILVQN